MSDFIRFFLKFDLWPMMAWLPILPFLMLPVALLVWLLMVAAGLAPLSWKGFLFNWLIVAALFVIYFINKRLRANWSLFKTIREKGRSSTAEE